MLVPYNQHVVRDRAVAGHVALRGWLATRLDDIERAISARHWPRL
jgi:hypothetical protein